LMVTPLSEGEGAGDLVRRNATAVMYQLIVVGDNASPRAPDRDQFNMEMILYLCYERPIPNIV
jgi:hypothetical protein